MHCFNEQRQTKRSNASDVRARQEEAMQEAT